MHIYIIYIYFGFLRKTTIVGHYTVFYALILISNLQMAKIYLVFLKNKNTCIKVRVKLFVKQQDMFNLRF